MKYFDLYASYPDYTIAAAWDSQVKEAERTPWLATTLTHCGDELLARFAVRYAELRALPRGARRNLQRRIARSSELAAILQEHLQHGGRRLQHRMAWSLAGAALLLALGQGVATAATITVTTNNPNIIADGQCSLIEAIVNANNDSATHTDCAAGSGADTIVLPANANLILSAVDNFSSVTGLPSITSQITIEGNGATIARQAGAPYFGLIEVRGDLTLQSVTLSGGSGWGVVNRGTLTIKNSTISGNSGVGIFNNPLNGSLTVVNSTISGNTGGGISNFYKSATVRNSTISGNTGFGIQNSGWGGHYAAVLTLSNSVVSGNQGTAPSEIMNVYSYVYANNFNLFGSNGNAGVSGFTPGPTDIVPAAGFQLTQILGPLANNGGPTDTHALVPGSPAIDAGDPGGCQDSQGALWLTDQRGFARHVDGNSDGTIRCDIGAVEFGAEFVPTGPLAIGATTLVTGEAGVSFTSDLMISGGITPYIVSITKGKLPSGLSLGNDGIISGTLSQNAKSAKITVRITDSVNESVTQTFTITVVKAVRIAEKAKTGRVGKDYRASFKPKGGRGPFSWSITSGVLPPDLNFNTATGAITGIPTQAGEFPLTVQVTDALGGVEVENLTLRIR